MQEYRTRIVDRLLAEKLAEKGAVVIEVNNSRDRSKQYEVTSDMQQRGFGISCGKLTTSRHALPHAKEITS
jgi:hypothetical protein